MSRDDGSDQKVGYKNPPIGSRFQPGTSGNSKGRPKASPNTVAMINAVMNEKVPVLVNGKRKWIPTKELFIRQTTRDAIKGKPGPSKTMVSLIQIADRGAAEEAAKKPNVTIVLHGADAKS